VTGSATPTSGVDTAPPKPVSRFVVRALGGRVALAWRNPSDRDFGTAVVVRKLGSAPTSPTDGKVVYRGERSSLLDYPFSLRTVNYAVFAMDEDDNAADAVRASLPRFDPPLRTPLDRSKIRQTRPRFTWKRVAGADGYNVHVWAARACCDPRRMFINQFPKTTSLRPPRALARGTYVWYVLAHVKPGAAASSYARVNRAGWRFTVR
jgi:hypothetical protein